MKARAHPLSLLRSCANRDSHGHSIRESREHVKKYLSRQSRHAEGRQGGSARRRKGGRRRSTQLFSLS